MYWFICNFYIYIYMRSTHLIMNIFHFHEIKYFHVPALQQVCPVEVWAVMMSGAALIMSTQSLTYYDQGTTQLSDLLYLTVWHFLDFSMNQKNIFSPGFPFYQVKLVRGLKVILSLQIYPCFEFWSAAAPPKKHWTTAKLHFLPQSLWQICWRYLRISFFFLNICCLLRNASRLLLPKIWVQRNYSL